MSQWPRCNFQTLFTFQALESKHVSAHLQEWVDLIFGFKQKGTVLLFSEGQHRVLPSFQIWLVLCLTD